MSSTPRSGSRPTSRRTSWCRRSGSAVLMFLALGARCLRAGVVHLAPAQLGALAARGQRRRGVRGRAARLPRRPPAPGWRRADDRRAVPLHLARLVRAGHPNTWQGPPAGRRGPPHGPPPGPPAGRDSPRRRRTASPGVSSRRPAPRDHRPEASRRSGDHVAQACRSVARNRRSPLDDQVLLLAERPPDQVAALLGAVLVEDLGRDRHHLRALGHGGAERDAVGVPERGHVGGHEVGALRHVHLQAQRVEAVAEEVAAPREVVAQLLVEGRLVVERVRDGRLEGGAGGVGQPVLRTLHGGDQVGRPGGPADLPAGEGEGLARARDRHRPVEHARQGGDRDVRVARRRSGARRPRR